MLFCNTLADRNDAALVRKSMLCNAVRLATSRRRSLPEGPAQLVRKVGRLNDGAAVRIAAKSPCPKASGETREVWVNHEAMA